MLRFGKIPVRWRLALAGAILASAPPGLPVAAPADHEMTARAFEGAQWVLATEAARAVAQVSARLAAGTGPLADTIRSRQRLEADLDKVRADLIWAAQSAPDRAPDLSDRLAGIQAELDRIDEEIRRDFPDYAELSSPRPLSFDAVRAALESDEALVLFLAGRRSVFVWTVTQSQSAWHRAALPDHMLADMVRRLRADLDPTGPSRAAAPLSETAAAPRADFDAGTAHALYRALLAPVMDSLAQVSHVFVVKDGALASLPLAVLLTETPPEEGFAPEDLARAPWLLRRFAVTTLPAVSSLSAIRSGHGDRVETAGFTGFGDPDFAGSSPPPDRVASRSIDRFFDADGTRVDAVRSLAPLPGTARELRRIASLFPPELVQITLGADATESAVKRTDLSRTSILSFATHGLVTGDISGLAEPALAFTPPETASSRDDGLLTASEASALELNADWVILSACNTAAGDGTPGAEGLSGLARAFLFAGAQSLLVSHWPVRDDVAARLTTDTLRRLSAQPGLARSEALRLSMLALMEDPTDSSLAHPSAWAPFVVVGEGGALDQ